MSQFDPSVVRNQFPIFLKQSLQNNSLVYLDNAATTQKPQMVIDAISAYYGEYNGNIGRGIYWPATEATKKYEKARSVVQEFINAQAPENIVFTSGATDGINKIVNSFLLPRLTEKSNVIISEMEHHANFIPWQQACIHTKSELRVIPLETSGDLDLGKLDSLIDKNTAMIALTAVSNTIGSKTDVSRVIQKAHSTDIPVLIDAAQWVSHERLDIQLFDPDFLVFSGHKLYGPTGIGVLYGKEQYLDVMSPLQYGGGIVKEVRISESKFLPSPKKHEAGTPNIAGAIGLAAAIEFISGFDRVEIKDHLDRLVKDSIEKIESLNGIKVLGNPTHRGPLFSFYHDSIHPHDIAGFLAENGVAIRAGHHCTQPLIDFFGLPGVCRVSFGIYNSEEDISKLYDSLSASLKFFS